MRTPLSVPSLALPVLGSVLMGCSPDKAPDSGNPEPATIELLSHTEGRFETAEQAAGLTLGGGFSLGGVDFRITEYWPAAEAIRETTDDNPIERHAVEIAWTDATGADHSRWIHQAAADSPAAGIEDQELTIQLCPPGARPPQADADDFAGQVQFHRDGRHYDLPQPGKTIFPGWKLKESRSYQRALLAEDGAVEEAPGGSFRNRLLEVFIESEDETLERHIVFLDHPEITRGIHPEILPVSRLAGSAASLSRLVVRAPMKASDVGHQIRISPAAEGGSLEVQLLRKGADTPETMTLAELPATVALADDKELRLLRHFDHARALVRWQQCEDKTAAAAKPALVLEHWATGRAERIVLIEDQVTPATVRDDMIMLRYRSDTSAPTASQETATPEPAPRS